MKTFYLREIAHARAGDKGDTSNIGVIAYEPHYYPLILEQVTPDRVNAHFGGIVKGRDHALRAAERSCDQPRARAGARRRRHALVVDRSARQVVFGARF